MSYPASTTTLQQAFDNSNGVAIRLREKIVSLSTRSAAGPVPRSELLQLQRDLTQALTIWDATRNLPGIVAFAQGEFGNPALDVAAEFLSMRNAAETMRDWIYNNFPRDAGTGAVLVETVNQVGDKTILTFTSAQLATFRTHCDALAATIS